MFIDFEGIDGSGKTTLSNRLAERLKALGHRVTHAREGGELQSAVARRIRELTRDSSLLELCPETEFFLNLARDAQQRTELIAPALARGEVCITDRYLPSQLALSGAGRGLAPDALAPPVEVASGGVWPDLIIFIDVDPDLARLRKRLAKASGLRPSDGDSRKGLAGAGLALRMREGFLAQAKADPDRWLVVENDAQPLPVLEQRIVDVVVARLEGRERPVERIVPTSESSPVQRLSDVEPRFFETLDRLEVREPALALWLMTGAPGPRAHQRRVAALQTLPGLVALSLAGLDDPESHQMRELLATVCPAEVAASLGATPSDASMALRERLYACAPVQVLAGLKRNDGPASWGLRERALGEGRLAAVLPGLAGLDTARAWALRERGVEMGLAADVARSLGAVGSPHADTLRERMFAQDRLAVLRSTEGLDTPAAWRIREALFAAAPKLVLRSLTGLGCARADAMRESGAPHTKEALDAVDALDTPAAWSLRERYVERYPSTVVNSLKGLPLTPRAETLVLRALAAFPEKLALLRSAYAFVRSVRTHPGEGAGPTAVDERALALAE
ncbi:MAG: dTMP kinase [Myxococcaceae bacterium]|nr:dTMP kinase [Myxococcaceae bacterium]